MLQTAQIGAHRIKKQRRAATAPRQLAGDRTHMTGHANDFFVIIYNYEEWSLEYDKITCNNAWSIGEVAHLSRKYL
jgi:hypothetical protein